MTKVSLILMCWNTAHLLARTLVTLQKQALDNWELIIVDDNSEDNVVAVLDRFGQGLPTRYFRLEHSFGMRGNTVSINYGVSKARGEIVMWSTPEVMLPPGALEAAYSAHQEDGLFWVTVPSHGLVAELQLCIDDVDWESDVHNVKKLVESHPVDSWPSVWFHLNFFEHGRWDGKRKQNYGNNQTVAVKRKRWLDTVGWFPLFMDYGSDDPWSCDERRKKGYKDVTLWEQEAYHQWHTSMQYWMALGKAPYWNKHGHTIDNLLGDPRVPAGGTCEIWDGGKKDRLSKEEAERVLNDLGEATRATGYRKWQ